jgi:hypothetical protein
MRRKFLISWTCLGVVFVGVPNSSAVSTYVKVFFRATAGVGYLPLKDWRDFIRSVDAGEYRQERFGSYWEFGVGYNLSERHIMILTVGGIGTHASTHDTFPNESSIDVALDFKTSPISLSYEFYLTKSDRQVSPIIGVGFAYLISELNAKSIWIGPPYGEDISYYERNGEGYGVHLYLALEAEINPHIHLVSRLRGSYADGMAFTDKKGDIKIEFTGIDIAMGISWRP